MIETLQKETALSFSADVGDFLRREFHRFQPELPAGTRLALVFNADIGDIADQVALFAVGEARVFDGRPTDRTTVTGHGRGTSPREAFDAAVADWIRRPSQPDTVESVIREHEAVIRHGLEPMPAGVHEDPERFDGMS